jgi:hypothetical protein
MKLLFYFRIDIYVSNLCEVKFFNSKQVRFESLDKMRIDSHIMFISQIPQKNLSMLFIAFCRENLL